MRPTRANENIGIYYIIIVVNLTHVSVAFVATLRDFFQTVY